MASTARRFRFDGFQFDLDTGELTGPTGSTRLQPKPSAMLGLLLSRAGELVTREELQQRLWPETQVEFDQGLNTCVRQIRAALGEDAGEGGRIETLPRRGYRLRVPVEPLEESNRRRPALRWVAALAAMAALAGLGGVLWRASSTVAPTGRTLRVAVLPLEDPGGDENSQRSNDLLTEALVVRLTTAKPRLAVLGPATTSVYRGVDTPHTEIGRALAVDFVVSGGFRSGRFFVQMVRTSDGEHVFAERIDSVTMPDEGAVRTIAAGIVEKLRTLP
ncbi:MAG TPA: winged helix-turn-helix domain-containing protein [Candidatus Polarisedimenticolaceae bacterium]|nr:winged helix-turn-helix domain-containing protein [Candidatus Polarisedimenticolaceae bacterium]